MYCSRMEEVRLGLETVTELLRWTVMNPAWNCVPVSVRVEMLRMEELEQAHMG